jgi:endonuclease/exonuclease/phosphatase family metal-dependent hydrolase
VHGPGEEKSDDSKDGFYKKIEQFYKCFPKYHTKILLGDFNTKVGRENFLKPTIGNKSLHQDSNDNGVRIVYFATSKNRVVKSTMFPHRNICKYTRTYPDRKTHNQIDHILIDGVRHSRILNV